MKKVLLGSVALLLSAGIAAAEVTVSGSGRMGVLKPFNDDGNGLTPFEGDADNDDVKFTSRIRIIFAGSGETDGGLAFGGTIRADNSGGGNGVDGDQTEGSVFISGAFGRLSMGDVSGAAEAAVGDLAGVGLTGLGDLNEFTYLSNSTDGRSAARYDYTTGAFGVHLSADNPADDADVYSIAFSYNDDTFAAGLGYEDSDDGNHIIAGASGAFAGATVKAIYGTFDGDGVADFDQYGLSVDYAFGAASVTGFYRVIDNDGTPDLDIYGIGAAYDLGGGAEVVGGYVVDDPSSGDSEDAFDFGISFTF